MRTGFKPYKATQGKASKNYGSQVQTISKSNGERYPIDVVQFNVVNPAAKEKTKHPTQKPVDLLSYLIQSYTQPGMTVLDNCMGSGSTGVACEATNRNFIGIEQNAEFFDIAKKRIGEAQMILYGTEIQAIEVETSDRTGGDVDDSII